MCIRWVPQSLVYEHKTERKAISFELLVCFDTEGETIYPHIFTGDETWVHHFEPERKRKQSVEWHQSRSPWKKKIRKFPSVGKVTVTLFWSCEGAVLENVLLTGEAINCDACIRTLTEYRKHFKQVRFHKNPQKSCFIMTVQGRKQIWRLGKPSQNLVVQCNPLHPTAVI